MDIPLNVIPIEPEGYHLLMHAIINGYKANVLVDTGASRTIMDLSRAGHYLASNQIRKYNKFFTGMGAGKIDTYVTTLPIFSVGSIRLTDLEILLIDMSSINASYALYDLPRIDMVLGGDLLVKLSAVIDYQKKILKTTTSTG